jgi:hypothetical protein
LHICREPYRGYKLLGTALSGPIRTLIAVRAMEKENSREEGGEEMKMRR